MVKNILKCTPSKNPQQNYSLVSVDRAVVELRKGRCVIITSENSNPILALAAETITKENFSVLKNCGTTPPLLAMPRTQAPALSLELHEETVIILKSKDLPSHTQYKAYTDTVITNSIKPPNFEVLPLENGDCVQAAVKLAKIASLLPTICFICKNKMKKSVLENWGKELNCLLVDSKNIINYQSTVAKTLQLVSEAKVPIKNAENCLVSAFRAFGDSQEHLAILIGTINKKKPVLTRIHSECFTGDILRSLRCDCGDQLHDAIRKIASLGCGILLYLRQEGRGLGLVNKLRTYNLQDSGINTFDANNQIGFDDDERDYAIAFKMLEILNIKKIRLMTNNPEKIKSLTKFNLEIVERVPHSYSPNKHNQVYLKTKKAHGHFLE